MREPPPTKEKNMHKQWKILIALLTLGGALFVAKQFQARRAG